MKEKRRDLNDCPFCGREVKHSYKVEREGDFYFVRCACGASGSYAPSEDGAVDAWNRRVMNDDVF